MRTNALEITCMAAVALFAGACSEASTPASLDERPAFVVTGCDLVPGFAAQLSAFLNNDVPDRIGGLLQNLATACASGDQTGTSGNAWQILSIVADRYGASRTGDPSIGSPLANGLLACTLSLCDSAALPGIDFTSALGGGIFSVHSSDTDPAIARDLQNFLDFDGSPRTARWGVEVTAPWSQVTATNPVLVYGAPLVKGSLPLNELSIGDLLYELNVFPDAGEFVGDDLHVGVCFDADVTLPPSINGLEARMRREGVLLEDWSPTFCAAQASVLAPLAASLRRLLPSAIADMLRIDTKIRIVGGSPLDFSRFAPIGAQVNGYLEFVSVPDPKPTRNQSVGTIQVRAFSGDGTPMEKVLVSLYLRANNGEPAGARLSGDDQSLTEERIGIQGIATFPDDGRTVTIGKPGGYRVCAAATFGGFNFDDICSDIINVKNSH